MAQVCLASSPLTRLEILSATSSNALICGMRELAYGTYEFAALPCIAL